MLTRSTLTAIATVLLLSTSMLAWANDMDEAGNLIATPREAEMMEKGYLYFPPRVIRKTGAVKTIEAKAAETKPQEAKAPALQPLSPVSPAVLIHQDVAKVQPLKTAPASLSQNVATEPEAAPGLVAEPAPATISSVNTTASEKAGDKNLQNSPQNSLFLPEQLAKSSAYVGGGTGLTIGLSTPLPGGGSYRLEFSNGFNSPQIHRSYGGSAYRTTREEQQLGLFVDWSPYDDNWYVSGGLTLNNHHIRVKTVVDSSLSIDYKLPVTMTYVGVRYAYKSSNDKGWEGFGEVGVLLGKLNATAETTSSDKATVQAEVDRIRNSIYQWSVVPKAIVGVSYKY